MDDDCTVEVVELTGDDSGDALDKWTLGTVQEVEDFVNGDENVPDGDGWAPVCGVIEEADKFGDCSVTCACCPAAALSEEEMIVIPERRLSEWRAVSKSTPLADLFENAPTPTSAVAASSSTSRSDPARAVEAQATEAVKQGFYQCRWDVLSSYSDESDSQPAGLVDSENEEDVPVDIL